MCGWVPGGSLPFTPGRVEQTAPPPSLLEPLGLGYPLGFSVPLHPMGTLLWNHPLFFWEASSSSIFARGCPPWDPPPFFLILIYSSSNSLWSTLGHHPCGPPLDSSASRPLLETPRVPSMMPSPDSFGSFSVRCPEMPSLGPSLGFCSPLALLLF